MAAKPSPDCEVFIGPTAFLSIAVAAVEVYPRETVGILIGLRGGKKIWVEYAVPIQTADRKDDTVSWRPHIARRIKRFMTGSTALEVVGGFHSHPWPERKSLYKGMNRLSKADLKSWKPPEIEVVASVIKNGGVDSHGKALAWKHLKGGTLQGAIGDYAVRMTAWYSRDGVQKKPRIAYVRCPFATGMDR